MKGMTICEVSPDLLRYEFLKKKKRKKEVNTRQGSESIGTCCSEVFFLGGIGEQVSRDQHSFNDGLFYRRIFPPCYGKKSFELSLGFVAVSVYKKIV